MKRRDALKVANPNPDRCTRDVGGRGIISAGLRPAHHVPKRGEVPGGFCLLQGCKLVQYFAVSAVKTPTAGLVSSACQHQFAKV